jgi:hypothetical protein
MLRRIFWGFIQRILQALRAVTVIRGIDDGFEDGKVGAPAPLAAAGKQRVA